MNDKSVLLTNFGTPDFMLNLLPDKYRACNKTDTVEIRRDPECEFNPEPTTIPRVPITGNRVIRRNLRGVVLNITAFPLLLARKGKPILLKTITIMLCFLRKLL